MSVQLLDKTRKINKLLHNNSSSKVVFNDICEVLTSILESDILVISKKGKVLGAGVCKGVEVIEELIVDEVGGFIDSDLNERLLGILSTKENVNLETLGFDAENRKYRAIITPIAIAGERFGTLFVYRSDSEYDIDVRKVSGAGAFVSSLNIPNITVTLQNTVEVPGIQSFLFIEFENGQNINTIDVEVTFDGDIISADENVTASEEFSVSSVISEEGKVSVAGISAMVLKQVK